MFKLFEIRDGKFTTLPDISSKKLKSILFGSVVVFLVTLLSLWLKVDEKDVWKFYNLILQQLGLTGEEFRPKNEKEIESRIELEVDKAIRDVTPEYERIILKQIKNINQNILMKRMMKVSAIAMNVRHFLLL